ncbi:MAG: hypothetical protein ACRDNK_06125 [Solirubrobacteraceae bacterium]
MAAAAVLAAAPGARADGPLSLAISSPRIEEAPITFSASGVAPGADSFGESIDYLKGAVLPQTLSCPPGPDDFDKIPGSILDTLDAFPIGSFNVNYLFTPRDGDLVGGDYRECAYLVDRATNSTMVSSQEEFAVRKPQVRLRVLRMPSHMRFSYDSIGRPVAHLTFLVRASAEVADRNLLLSFRRTSSPCTGNPDRSEFGGVDVPPRVKPGPARIYRLHPFLVMHPGPFPYGRRIRACVAVAYYQDSSNAYLPEGGASATLQIHR